MAFPAVVGRDDLARLSLHRFHRMATRDRGPSLSAETRAKQDAHAAAARALFRNEIAKRRSLPVGESR